MAIATNLGYPRIGRNRELKRATEAYWAGKATAEELAEISAQLRAINWQTQHDAGIDLIPSNDFSLYDHVLDTIALVGAVPPRYGWDGGTVDLDTYFAMARGSVKRDLPAMEMTKWFNTNYHYIVPEFWRGMHFSLATDKLFVEFAQARDLGFQTKPVLVGPLTFLLLGKSRDEGLRPLDLLDALLSVYIEVLKRLSTLGAEWVQFDEPALVLDRTPEDLEALTHAYDVLAKARGNVNIAVQTYFDQIGEAYDTLAALPVQAIGLDFVHGRQGNLAQIAHKGFPADKMLVAGVVDGRNVWINDLATSLDLLEGLPVPSERLMVAPSCSLLHVPIDVTMEAGLTAELQSWLAFADQKLAEVVTLTRGLGEGREAISTELTTRAEAIRARRESTTIHRPEVKARVAAVNETDIQRSEPFAQRHEKQRQALCLPPFPTTTIGSFPQTAEVRRMRRQFESGQISADEYEHFIEGEIRRAIALQEEIGLDVLVHGEFERSDMVEYFAERMKGFVFTRHGWVQSYGTRYVRPPIIFGDVWRPEPMTVRWFRFAQSLTDKPVKGMLTGPVTILNWSFVRDDQPRSETCLQIALAIRDEVHDLEIAGARIIQIDEPALREGLPLRRADWHDYLDWAIRCFRIASSGVSAQTQIHTHMCYSDFNSIIDAIQALDADVISIENSRSDLELLDVFRRTRYSHDIGPGVYDIHSPRIPSEEEIVANLEAATSVLAIDQLWVNPDCGLKTRRWEEVEPSLRNMVGAAHRLRERLAVPAR
jgi:5-methyltetrahydropteroyltriglutamate--homocysteine methyltransferase